MTSSGKFQEFEIFMKATERYSFDLTVLPLGGEKVSLITFKRNLVHPLCYVNASLSFKLFGVSIIV